MANTSISPVAINKQVSTTLNNLNRLQWDTNGDQGQAVFMPIRSQSGSSRSNDAQLLMQQMQSLQSVARLVRQQEDKQGGTTTSSQNPSLSNQLSQLSTALEKLVSALFRNASGNNSASVGTGQTTQGNNTTPVNTEPVVTSNGVATTTPVTTTSTQGTGTTNANPNVEITANSARLKNFNGLVQYHSLSCGPTSLTMVLNFMGMNLDQRDVDSIRPNKSAGLAPSVIRDGAKKFGAEASVQDNATFEEIDAQIRSGQPPILLINNGTGGQHYVVAIGTSTNAFGQREIEYLDPMTGQPVKENFDAFVRNRWGNIKENGASTGMNNLMITISRNGNLNPERLSGKSLETDNGWREVNFRGTQQAA